VSGTTLNYSRQAVGFFVAPLDPAGNNLQVFVVAAAVRHISFP
jgi:hypothetical protein